MQLGVLAYLPRIFFIFLIRVYGKLMFTLCCIWAETTSKHLMDSISATCLLVDLNVSLSKGYQVTKIFDIEDFNIFTELFGIYIRLHSGRLLSFSLGVNFKSGGPIQKGLSICALMSSA